MPTSSFRVTSDFEERLQGLNVEDLLKRLSLEYRLRGFNAEERRKLKQLLGNLDEKRGT